MQPPSSHRHEAHAVVFKGNSAVYRLLASAGLRANKVQVCLGTSSTWEADTDKGKRWVSHGAGGWRISKTPPEAKTAEPHRPHDHPWRQKTMAMHEEWKAGRAGR